MKYKYDEWANNYLMASDFPVCSIRELKKDPAESTLHVEIDCSGFSYQTG